MSAPSSSWDESSPAGSDALNQGDNSIRLAKTQIREVIDVDHKFNSSGTDADNGCHDQVTLLEKADLGTGAVGKTILGSQTVAGQGELVYTDENNLDVQLTSLGKLYLDAGRLSNNIYLIARNAANSANINLIKANASDAVEIPNGVVLSSSSAPTTDPMIPNKKYVDDQNTAQTAVFTLASILDYGTSASLSTTKTQAALKIAYGTLSIGASSNTAISNLPFSSSSSYIIIITQATNSTANENLVAIPNSGSGATVYNKWPSGTLSISWIAIGT